MPKRYKNSAPRDKTRVQTGHFFPMLIAHPYPDSCPNAHVEAGVYFYKAGEWFTNYKNDIYFIDQFTRDTVYFNQLNTQNQYHLMRGEFIVTELLDKIAYIPEGKNAQNYFYIRPDSILFENVGNPKAAASTKKGGVLAINTHAENGLEGNIYKLMSIFRHEILHIREQPLYKENWGGYTFEAHANVYEEQMTYPEFLKTPENYQLHILRHYVLRVFNACYKGSFHQPNKFINTLKEFNEGTGKKVGATLEIQKIPQHLIKNRIDVKVIIYMNGVHRTTVEYEEIEEAYK